jgi:putative membrane protein
MSLPIERARARRPITWLTILGVLLLPVVIGGILVFSLYNPTERLDGMHAAIVNDDAPVTVDGQMVPLGRQLTAGLVKGSSSEPSNLDWTVSNTKDAARGLADGTYQAVITIPQNFTAAALSPGQSLQGRSTAPERATIKVQTAKGALTLDNAITAQVTQTAASVMGTSLSSTTLQNVFIGYSTLGDKLGDAAGGAVSLASGARSAADGASSLASGVGQLSTGASQLSSGLDSWAAGAGGAATGLDSWAAGAKDLSAHTSTLATNLSAIASGFSQLSQIPQSSLDTAVGAADQLAADRTQIKASVTDAAAQLKQLAATCTAQGGSVALCSSLQTVSDQTQAQLGTVTGVIDQSGTIASAVSGLTQLPAAAAGLSSIAGGMNQVAGGMTNLAGGATDAASGVQRLADGAAQLAAGGRSLADGASSAAAGASSLATGVSQLGDGADSLSSGLETAASSLPRYTDAQAKSLANVLADPVAAKGLGGDLFGASAIPLLATIALWFGGLGSFIALQAVSRRALSSRRPSALLALRALAPAAAIGAAQGLLVAGIVQLAASYDAGTWWAFAGVSVAAGIAFAAVNQAFVAVFGGAGRWVSALVGVLAVATGIVSTVPGVLSAVAGLMPTSPAYNGMLSALASVDGVGAGLAGLVLWSLIGFAATTIAVARRRTTSARALLRPAPLLA